ncbi:Transmembrane protein [Pseudocercospora fuligena]|uniref:Transmembrane protein n=1 Tax=Pseudocercospora fuligena TaxID=685502 RepID=A0A8H6RHS0_9PEZI|nr:Transmembrane protein [Pseudocercospora fuligena]
MDPDTPLPEPSPSIFRWVLGFLIVGACWGLTTPFMRRAAITRDTQPKPSRPLLESPNTPWVKKKIWGIIYAVYDLLKNPAYAVPLLLNVTGSVWFFILVGQAELSLTVPITNSLAFLFTVLGEWWAEGKVISRDTWIGMGLVLGGIALCVHSKTSS